MVLVQTALQLHRVAGAVLRAPMAMEVMVAWAVPVTLVEVAVAVLMAARPARQTMAVWAVMAVGAVAVQAPQPQE